MMISYEEGNTVYFILFLKFLFYTKCLDEELNSRS